MAPTMALHWKPKGMPDTPPRKIVDLPPQSPVTTHPRPTAPTVHSSTEHRSRSSRSQPRQIYGPPTPAVQTVPMRRDSSSTTRTDESVNLKSCLKQRKSSSGYNTDDPSTRSRTEQPVHVKLSSSRKSGAPPPLAHGSSYMSGYSTSNESYESSRRSSASNDSHRRQRTSSQSRPAEQQHQHRMHSHTPPRQIYANAAPNTPYVPASQPHVQHRHSEDREARTARHNAEKIIVPLKEPEITLSWPLVKRNKSSGARKMDHDEVLFDIGLDPNQIRLRHDPFGTRRPQRDEFKFSASSHETIHQMEIFLQDTIIDHLGFKIVVRREGGIKCSDVFKDIYEFFNVRLSSLPPFSPGLLPHNFDQLPLCKQQFKLRCERTPGLAFVEQRYGLRVVDLLLGNTRFLGLTRDHARKVWVMELGQFENR